MVFTPISPFGRLLDAGMSAIEALAAIAITYRRGALEVSGSAVPAASQFTSLEDETATTEMDLVDLIVARSFPDFGGGWTEPEQGDEVEFVDPLGVTRSLIVVRPNPAEPPWRFSDSGQTRIVIHLAFVEELP